MASVLKLRRGNSISHNTFTGQVGEVTFNTDTSELVSHDGVTAGGFTGGGYMPAGVGAASRSVQSKLREIIHVKDFGAKGDWNGASGTDDHDAILNALTAAAGRTVVLESGKTYLIGSSLNYTGNVSLTSSGAVPAVIFQNGQGFTPLVITGSVVFTRNLAVSQQIHNHGWDLDTAAGVLPGMLVEVMSSAPWYHDDRGEAKKSELHRVAYVVGNTVFMEDLSNDGYNLALETVTLAFYAPVSVKMDNVTVRCVHAPTGVDAARVTGLIIAYGYAPTLLNVNTENAAGCGISLKGCFGALVEGGHSHGSNNYWTGYGVQFSGSANGRVTGRKFWSCRRGVDVSGMAIITRHTLIDSNTNHGGGVNSEGMPYGWSDDGVTGAAQFGFGSHGPADHTIYRGNTISRMHSFINCRGRNELIEDNNFVGRSRNGAISASYGENLTVKNNRAYMGTGAFKYATVIEGGANLNSRRADYFIYFNDTYQGGEIIVEGNHVECQEALLYFTSTVYPNVTLSRNRVRFATSAGDTECFMAFNAGASAVAESWVVVDNDYRRVGGSGDVSLLSGIVQGISFKLVEITQGVMDGEWTPTVEAISNVGTITASRSLWSRVGNRVTFNASIAVTPTAAGIVRFSLNLPVIRSNFTSTTSGGGVIGLTSIVATGGGGIYPITGTSTFDCRVHISDVTATGMQITGAYEL